MNNSAILDMIVTKGNLSLTPISSTIVSTLLEMDHRKVLTYNLRLDFTDRHFNKSWDFHVVEYGKTNRFARFPAKIPNLILVNVK